MTYLYTDSSGKTYVMDQGGIRVGNNKSSIPKDATKTYIISEYYKFTYD